MARPGHDQTAAPPEQQLGLPGHSPLGCNPKTIETHATASGADYARYVGAIVGSR